MQKFKVQKLHGEGDDAKVAVNGFKSKALNTWIDFPNGRAVSIWWLGKPGRKMKGILTQQSSWLK